MMPWKDTVCFTYAMDDLVILTKNRWVLRRAVRKVNGILSELKLEKAEDKTFIGKIERGFDFLGYHFSLYGLSLAEKTVHNFAERLSLRCYASGRKSGFDCGWKPIGLDNCDSMCTLLCQTTFGDG